MKDALGHGSAAHGTGIEQRVPRPLNELPRAALLKAIEKESAKGSDITTRLIAAGYGNVKGMDIIKEAPSNPLAEEYRLNSEKLMALHDERQSRLKYQGTEHPIKKSRWL